MSRQPLIRWCTNTAGGHCYTVKGSLKYCRGFMRSIPNSTSVYEIRPIK